MSDDVRVQKLVQTLSWRLRLSQQGCTELLAAVRVVVRADEWRKAGKKP